MKRWRPTPSIAPVTAPAEGGTVSAAAVIRAFLTDLQHLRGVPLSYMVPYPAMLPPETLCFFYIDPNWMAALYQGALSLAGFPSTLMPSLPSPSTQGTGVPCFGFLLNSQIVSHFPNSIYTATGANSRATVAPCRLETINATTLIGLYDEPLISLNVSQPLEGFQLGFLDFTENTSISYTQILRCTCGSVGAASRESVTFTARQPTNGAMQVIGFADLFTQMNTAAEADTSAFPGGLTLMDFGMQIIAEAVQLNLAIKLPSAPSERTI